MTNENKLLERLTKQSCVFFFLLFISSIFITKVYGQEIFDVYEDGQNQDFIGQNKGLEEYEEASWKNEKGHNTEEIK